MNTTLLYYREVTDEIDVLNLNSIVINNNFIRKMILSKEGLSAYIMYVYITYSIFYNIILLLT